MNNTATMAIALTIATGLAGCDAAMKGEKAEAWSSKEDSVVKPVNENPTLNAAEQLPAGPVANVEQLREPAISILMQAADSTNPLLRANAIESLQNAPEQLNAVVRKGLADENRGVRFVAAMTVGKAKMTEMALLLEPLLHDPSESVQAAAIYGLRRCGRKADMNPLFGMLLGEDPEVKGNAAMVLGELGEPSAIRVLRFSIGRGMQRATPARRKMVELQVAEAMVRLGDANELDVIHAALFAPIEEGELVAMACQMCGQLKDGSRMPDLRNLIRWSGKLERPPEIRLAAAWAIAQIDPSKLPMEVPIGYAESDRYEIRAQAAHVFAAAFPVGGGPNDAVALGYLAKMMADPNPLVQVSAAGGVVRASRKP